MISKRNSADLDGISVRRLTVAIDTGGTFTDLSGRLPDGDSVRLKVPSTPDDPARAVCNALGVFEREVDLRLADEAGSRSGRGDIAEIRHGTTVATNALLERRGARVVLVTTAGFEDLLRLRRQDRPDLYAVDPVVPSPLVPPERCVGVVERLDPAGGVQRPLEPLDAWIKRNQGVLDQAEVFGVSLLHAYANGAHERAVGAALQSAFPGRPAYLSHQLAPVLREYERTSTVAVNAYVAPVMAGYLDQLTQAVAPAELAVMGSAGGLLAASKAMSEPVHTVLSGPAGGVRGAWAVGRRCDRSMLLTLDMGGTSADVSLVTGELAPEDDGALALHPLRIPLLPIETVGAGGGSIAYVDGGGVLRVGPRSAGATPGPAAYGRGGPAAEPTVTDAHVVLGCLPSLLGGEMALDGQAARNAVGRVAEKLGATLEDTARAIIAVVEANMARACKRVTLERGVDPRTLTLVAFGGAGGLHACALADELGCPDVLFPGEPGVLSAEGMLDAPREIGATRTLILPDSEWPSAGLTTHFDALCAEITHALQTTAPQGRRTPAVDVSWQSFADCRYAGQTFTLPVPLSIEAGVRSERLRAEFNALHERRFGYVGGADRVVQLVSIRVYGRVDTPHAADGVAVAESSGEPAPIHGPRAITTYSATLWLPAQWQATRLRSGDLLCVRSSGTRVERRSAGPAAPLPLSLEVHRQRLAAIAEEMGATLMRAAFSANIKERRDFSCAIFDAQGRMLAQAAHIPVHLGSAQLSVEAAIDAVPMGPGDDVVLNDPFAGGTHLPDVTLVTPVYLDGAQSADGRPHFYVANRAHHADVGGISPGSLPAPRDVDGRPRSLTIEDEGFRIGPTKLTEHLRHRIACASRTPDERLGDLRAQEAANRLGKQRIKALVAEVGLAGAQSLDAALLDYSERRMRALIRRLPDGTYTACDHLDDDGITTEPVPIPVTVEITGDRVRVDFSAAPDAVPSSMNAVKAIAVSAVFYVFRCLAGEEMPSNAGLMRPIEVATRRGSIVDARWPAAVSAGNVETSQRLVDALWLALAQADQSLPAASGGTMNNVLFGGVDTRQGGRPFVHYETLACGAGGSAHGRGADAIHTHMTNTLNTPVEALEHAYPLRIERYAVRPPAIPAASSGLTSPQVQSGGAGIVRAYRFLVPAVVTLMSERRVLAPYGSNGAPAGIVGRNRLRRASGEEIRLPGKCTVAVDCNELLIVETPGGGGWQAPIE